MSEVSEFILFLDPVILLVCTPPFDETLKSLEEAGDDPGLLDLSPSRADFRDSSRRISSSFFLTSGPPPSCKKSKRIDRKD